MKNYTVTVLTLEEMLQEKSMQASISTLKRIYSVSADSKVLEMLNGLYADQKYIYNEEMITCKNAYTVSDGYDCFMVAYSYMLEQIEKGLCFNDDVTEVLKGGKEKTRTVFQWACVRVREHIYKHGQVDYKRLYVDNYKQIDVWGEEETESQVFDRLYLRVGKYYDMSAFEDVDSYNSFIKAISCKLTDRQKTVLHYRLQGLSVSAIADRLKVSQPAISKSLLLIQKTIKADFPEMVNGFKEKRVATR